MQHAYADLSKQFPDKALEVHLVGPSVVGSYYGRGDQVASRKGDFGRLLVLASNSGAAAVAARKGDAKPLLAPRRCSND